MKRILIVEDDRWIRENTRELLELESYEVLTAAEGQEGLKIIRCQRPDLILCDIVMPVMDGFQLLKAVREDPVLTSIPFIFFTASSEKPEIRKGLEMGADDYIIKPFSAEELMHTIEVRFTAMNTREVH